MNTSTLTTGNINDALELIETQMYTPRQFSTADSRFYREEKIKSKHRVSALKVPEAFGFLVGISISLFMWAFIAFVIIFL